MNSCPCSLCCALACRCGAPIDQGVSSERKRRGQCIDSCLQGVQNTRCSRAWTTWRQNRMHGTRRCLPGVQHTNHPRAKHYQTSTLANVKTAAIPLRSVHDDVFYVPTKMPSAQELVLPARARAHALGITRPARTGRKGARQVCAQLIVSCILPCARDKGMQVATASTSTRSVAVATILLADKSSTTTV